VRRGAAAALAACALAAAGCGGGGAGGGGDDGGGAAARAEQAARRAQAARQAYVARADAVCRHGNARLAPYARKLDKLEKAENPRRLLARAPALLRAAVRVSRRSVAALARLHPPARDAARIRRWLKGLRRQNRLAKQTAAAVVRGDRERLQRLAVQTRRLNARNAAFARAYGLKACGRGPV
jgi:hypothetical protein